jgi:hypothetical protein
MSIGKSLSTVAMAGGLAIAGGASATTLAFSYQEDLGFFLIDASWTQPSTPSPLAAISGDFTDIAVNNGVYAFGVPGSLTPGAFSDVDYYNAASSGPLGPGGFEAGPIGDFGPQLYSGAEAAPVFAPGTYALSQGTLSVTAVPEPATWSLMLVGFGALGVVLRSRRRASESLAT